MKESPVRDPENYSSALDAASDLREIADRVETHGGMIKFHCQISFRTEQAIQDALAKKGKKGTVHETNHDTASC